MFQQWFCIYPLSSAYSASLPPSQWYHLFCACSCIPIHCPMPEPQISQEICSWYSLLRKLWQLTSSAWEKESVQHQYTVSGKGQQQRGRGVRSYAIPPQSIPLVCGLTVTHILSCVFSVHSVCNTSVFIACVQAPLELMLMNWLQSRARSSVMGLSHAWKINAPALPWNLVQIPWEFLQQSFFCVRKRTGIIVQEGFFELHFY